MPHKPQVPIASATSPGILTTGAQTIAGVKTFNDGFILGAVGYLKSYTVSTLPLASTASGLICVSDDPIGNVLAYSDGSNWRRVIDGKIVNTPLVRVITSLTSELVSNGTFDSGISGWSTLNDVSWDANSMKLNYAANNARAWCAISTTAGIGYVLSFDVVDNTTVSGTAASVRVGTSVAAFDLGSLTFGGSTGTKTVSFTATGSTTYLWFDNAGSTSGMNYHLDNISVLSPLAALTENDIHIIVDSSSDGTLYLPTASGITGRQHIIKTIGAGAVTLDAYSSETIDGSATYAMSTPYQSVTLISNGTNWNIV